MPKEGICTQRPCGYEPHELPLLQSAKTILSWIRGLHEGPITQETSKLLLYPLSYSPDGGGGIRTRDLAAKIVPGILTPGLRYYLSVLLLCNEPLTLFIE